MEGVETLCSGNTRQWHYIGAAFSHIKRLGKTNMSEAYVNAISRHDKNTTVLQYGAEQEIMRILTLALQGMAGDKEGFPKRNKWKCLVAQDTLSDSNRSRVAKYKTSNARQISLLTLLLQSDLIPGMLPNIFALPQSTSRRLCHCLYKASSGDC